jgi:hypothetical protein
MCIFRKPYYFYNPLLKKNTDPDGVTYYEVTVWKTVGKKTRLVATFVDELYEVAIYEAQTRVWYLSNCHK